MSTKQTNADIDSNQEITAIKENPKVTILDLHKNKDLSGKKKTPKNKTTSSQQGDKNIVDLILNCPQKLDDNKPSYQESLPDNKITEHFEKKLLSGIQQDFEETSEKTPIINKSQNKKDSNENVVEPDLLQHIKRSETLDINDIPDTLFEDIFQKHENENNNSETLEPSNALEKQRSLENQFNAKPVNTKNFDLFKDPTENIIQNQQEEDLDVRNLKRWLNKKNNPKKELSQKVLLVVFFMIALCGALAGASIAFMFNTNNETIKQSIPNGIDAKINEFLDKSQPLDYFSSTAALPLDQLKNENNSEQNLFNKSDNQKNKITSNKKSSNNKIKTTAKKILPPTSILERDCNKPNIQLSAIEGGQTKINIKSSCPNKSVQIQYADLIYKRHLNDVGELEFILDCFAGDNTPIKIILDNKTEFIKKPVTKDLEQLTKVAVIWQGQEDLDLHAFEYGASEGEIGHIWEQSPSSYLKATHLSKSKSLGHGFLSTSSQRLLPNDPKIEVYTFINSPHQEYGAIKLALQHNKKDRDNNKETCGKNETTTLDYTTTVLVRNSKLEKNNAAAILNPCLSIKTAKYYHSQAVPDIIIGQ